MPLTEEQKSILSPYESNDGSTLTDKQRSILSPYMEAAPNESVDSGSGGGTRQMHEGARMETSLNPDFSVTEKLVGGGDPGYTAEAAEKAASLPELKNPAALTTALLEADPVERKKMLISMGVDVRTEGGLDFAHVNGKEFVVNKPGLSGADVLPFATDIVTSLFGAGAGSVVKQVATKPIKSMAKKALAVGITEGLVGAGREGLDVLAGGDFDTLEVAFTPLMAGGAEVLGPALRSLYGKMNPKFAAAFNKSKSLEEFILDKDGSINLEKLDDAKQIARAAVEDGSMPAESSEFLASFAEEAAKRDPKNAAELELKNIAKIDEAKSGLMRSFSEITNTDIEDAIPVFTGDVKIALDTKIKSKDLARKAFYNKALDGAPPIDTQTLHEGVDTFLKDSTKEVGDKFRKILENLRPENWDQLQSKYVEDLAEWERGVGGLMPRQGPKPKPPVSEISAEKLQSIAVEVGDLMDTGTRYNAVGADLKAALKERLMNGIGKERRADFLKGEAAHGEFKDFVSKIPGTFEGGVTQGTETTYGNTIKLLFEPPAGQEMFAIQAMERLYDSNPQAARDLIGARFKAQLQQFDLDPNAKPSEIMAKVFGSNPSEKKMFNNMMDIAADPKTVKNINRLRNMLEVGVRLEDVTEDEAIKRLVTEKFDPDVAHFVYVRLAISRAIKDKIDTNMADKWFQAATSPEFAKDWGKLMDSRRYMNAIAKDPNKQREFAEYMRTTDDFEKMLPRVAAIATSKRATQSEDK